MRGAPRGGSASRSKPLRARGQTARALARSERLRTPEQFAALAGERATWRASRRWVAVSARVGLQTAEAERDKPGFRSGDSVENSASAARSVSNAAAVRFGFTVGRRQARRAVQRAMVKRQLREAARNAAEALRPLAQGRSVDLVLRLRSPLPARSEMNLSELKRSLRMEADSLLAQLARHLREPLR